MSLHLLVRSGLDSALRSVNVAEAVRTVYSVPGLTGSKETPMSLLRDKSQFYRSMATLTNAGLPTVRALRQNHPGVTKRIAHRMADAVEDGEGDLGELMGLHPRVFSIFERQLVSVGQSTGRLDTVYVALADWLNLLGQLRGQVISGLLYPILLYHAGVVLTSGISILLKQVSLTVGIIQMSVLLGVPWAAVILYGLWRSAGPAGGVRPVPLDMLLLHLPILGSLVRKLNYAQFFRALGLALDAGVRVVDAVRLSADTCASPVLKARFRQTADSIAVEGCGFVEAFQIHAFPGAQNTLVESLLATGEQAGSMPEMAGRLGNIYWDDAELALRRIADLVPKLVYIALVVYMGFKVLSFWGQIIGMTTELAEP